MKKIKNHLIIFFICIFFIHHSFQSNVYAIPIDILLSQEMTTPIINNMCKKYDRNNLSEYIKLAKKFLKQTQASNTKTASSGFIGYVLTMLILSNDRIIETTFTMRNDGYELKQQIGPAIRNMIKNRIIDNDFNEVKDFYNNIFTKWAIPYIDKRCGFKF